MPAAGTAPGTWPGVTGRVLVLQHHRDIPAGFVGERLVQLGATLEVDDTTPSTPPDPRPYDLVVSLGSYDSAFDDSLPYVHREQQILAAAAGSAVPVLGICFGAQSLAIALGGSVRRSARGPEIGWLPMAAAEPDQWVDGTAVPDVVVPGPWLVWHHDDIQAPPGAVELARTPASLQAFRHGPHLGLQFHPEATLASIERWAAQDKSGLDHSGVEAPRLAAESAQRVASARLRAYELTDAFLTDRLAGAR